MKLSRLDLAVLSVVPEPSSLLLLGIGLLGLVPWRKSGYVSPIESYELPAGPSPLRRDQRHGAVVARQLSQNCTSRAVGRTAALKFPPGLLWLAESIASSDGAVV